MRQVQEQIESARRLNGPPLELPDGTPITASSKENETTLAFYVDKVYVECRSPKSAKPGKCSAGWKTSSARRRRML
ncbi:MULTISPECIES: hypothetical protein [unclassified Paenibacillus]|uniref:hypothetical protein n=1 Tax=unclassified Paenibacillus TaxID=185978 RepID=UPI00128BDAF6|nr:MULTISPECIES: hypothetical protein [unclassified Paenibacillus]